MTDEFDVDAVFDAAVGRLEATFVQTRLAAVLALKVIKDTGTPEQRLAVVDGFNEIFQKETSDA